MDLAEVKYVAETLELLETEIPTMTWRISSYSEGLTLRVRFSFEGRAGALRVLVGMDDPEHWTCVGRVDATKDRPIMSEETIMRRQSPTSAVRAVVSSLLDSTIATSSILRGV